MHSQSPLSTWLTSFFFFTACQAQGSPFSNDTTTASLSPGQSTFTGVVAGTKIVNTLSTPDAGVPITLTNNLGPPDSSAPVAATLNAPDLTATISLTNTPSPVTAPVPITSNHVGKPPGLVQSSLEPGDPNQFTSAFPFLQSAGPTIPLFDSSAVALETVTASTLAAPPPNTNLPVQGPNAPITPTAAPQITTPPSPPKSPSPPSPPAQIPAPVPIPAPVVQISNGVNAGISQLLASITQAAPPPAVVTAAPAPPVPAVSNPPAPANSNNRPSANPPQGSPANDGSPLALPISVIQPPGAEPIAVIGSSTLRPGDPGITVGSQPISIGINSAGSAVVVIGSQTVAPGVPIASAGSGISAYIPLFTQAPSSNGGSGNSGTSSGGTAGSGVSGGAKPGNQPPPATVGSTVLSAGGQGATVGSTYFTVATGRPPKGSSSTVATGVPAAVPSVTLYANPSGTGYVDGNGRTVALPGATSSSSSSSSTSGSTTLKSSITTPLYIPTGTPLPRTASPSGSGAHRTSSHFLGRLVGPLSAASFLIFCWPP